MNKLVLIDGNSIAYRAFFALPLLNNEKGVYTNAVYGFTMMLLKVIEEEQPTHMLVAFDAGKTTFRHKTFKEYKGTRQKTPPELSEQLPFIHEVVDLLGIPRYEKELYEADDLIGTLSKRAAKEGWSVKIFSGDKDLLQLVDDNITVSLTRKGITEVDEYTPEKVRERYEIDPIKVIDLKGFMGDNSDNIPGVPGVGEKTAIKLLKQFGSLEAVFDHLDEVSGKKLKEKLTEFEQQAYMSKELATIFTEAPVDAALSELTFNQHYSEDLIALFKELEFNTLLERIGFEEVKDQAAEEVDVSFETLKEVKPQDLPKEASLIVELNEENYHFTSINGFALYSEDGGVFIPKEVAFQSDAFKVWLSNPEFKKIVFDQKAAAVALHWHGIELKGVTFDVSLAAYLIDPSESAVDVAGLAKRHHIHVAFSDEAVYGKGAKRSIPADDVLGDHLARKAMALEKLVPILKEALEDNQQQSLYYELEMPLSQVLEEMEETGIAVSKEALDEMGKEFSASLDRLEKEIHQLAGVEFNINSPKQLGEILFEKLNLPAAKKTKTGYSTSADVLEKLAGQHEIIDKILEYRQLGKLSSTYIDGLLKVIHPKTGKIHTRYNQALTQTGRLSSTDPNLQNIPIRMEEGRRIRHAFIPAHEGWTILSADYSQIELRVLAHIAEDANLIEAFQEERDIHTKTAMDVFGVKEDEVTDLMRRHAKAVNFGIVYGISDFGLSQSLRITRKEAGAFIEKYLESYPGVKAYMTDVVQKAKRDGYVTTLLHRRRYLPDITSRQFNRRSFAERTAMNTPIQGSAADIIKMAMVNMSHRLKAEGLKSKMLLQVHDELIFEVPEEELELMKTLVPNVMEEAIELKVPLKADVSFGPTWYDAK
ncbi:DNA polymerase I [Pullulanibacillus sp. KACC 23026]|uniref:DNA polymerase I n=1 Tax=Pullulanibacillus sp. KACC 23026 TaxID=3028315 RepID=UPI0023AEC094|nr:DNA polymerase I [Pullulanibacillus sp. KACC 23026]WEG13910.1 DNA polymerase I [Pullulanibacillus sp. KACC 23026]